MQYIAPAVCAISPESVNISGYFSGISDTFIRQSKVESDGLHVERGRSLTCSKGACLTPHPGFIATQSETVVQHYNIRKAHIIYKNKQKRDWHKQGSQTAEATGFALPEQYVRLLFCARFQQVKHNQFQFYRPLFCSHSCAGRL